MSDNNDELEAIGHALRRAGEFNLEVEVVWSALKAMRQDSSLSPQDAIEIGLLEWDV